VTARPSGLAKAVHFSRNEQESGHVETKIAAIRDGRIVADLHLFEISLGVIPRGFESLSPPSRPQFSRIAVLLLLGKQFDNKEFE